MLEFGRAEFFALCRVNTVSALFLIKPLLWDWARIINFDSQTTNGLGSFFANQTLDVDHGTWQT